MASKRSAQAQHGGSRALQIARSDLATSLLQAIIDVGLSQEGAARVIGVAKRTVGAWVRREREMNVERVLAASRIGGAFRRALCTEHHEAPAGYVARKKTRGSK